MSSIRQFSNGQWFDLNKLFLLMISALFLSHIPLALCIHPSGQIDVKSLSMATPGGDAMTSAVSSVAKTCTDIVLTLGHEALPNLEAISFLRWLGQSVLAMLSVIFLSFVTGNFLFKACSNPFYPTLTPAVSPHLSEVSNTVLLL